MEKEELDQIVDKIELDRFWKDDRNWWHSLIYYCKDDPRLIVPRKWKYGWTFNYADSMAVPIVITILLFIISVLGIILMEFLF